MGGSLLSLWLPTWFAESGGTQALPGKERRRDVDRGEILVRRSRFPPESWRGTSGSPASGPESVSRQRATQWGADRIGQDSGGEDRRTRSSPDTSSTWRDRSGRGDRTTRRYEGRGRFPSWSTRGHR